MELVIRNGLAVRIDGDVPRYKTTLNGLEALRHFRELEVLIPKLRAISEEEEASS